MAKDVEDRLEVIAKKNGRTKNDFACAAILQLVEDLEDAALAEERLKDLGETISWMEVKAELFGSGKSGTPA